MCKVSAFIYSTYAMHAPTTASGHGHPASNFVCVRLFLLLTQKTYMMSSLVRHPWSRMTVTYIVSIVATDSSENIILFCLFYYFTYYMLLVLYYSLFCLFL